tara:strand:+ start:580 stop:765 length:186 start_codon:yes stop_codon:yes gene_type:complete
MLKILSMPIFVFWGAMPHRLLVPAAVASSGQLSWGLIHRGGAGFFPSRFYLHFLFARAVIF